MIDFGAIEEQMEPYGTHETDLIGRIGDYLKHDVSLAPLYNQLVEAIQSAVNDGVLPEGAHLPSERLLSTALGISRVTVRKSFASLVDQGILTKRQGAKTKVQRKVKKTISKMTGFSESLKARGMETELRWIYKKIVKPSPQESMALGIVPDEEIAKLSRVRIADGEPIAIEVASVPTVFLPTLDLDHDSLYATLEHFGNRPARGVQRVTASLMTPREAQYLGGAAGSPILEFERTCYLSNGRAVEYTRSRYNGTLFDFVSEIE